MIPADKIHSILQRFAFIEAKMAEGPAADEMIALSREYSELRPVAEQAQDYQRLVADIEEAEAMLEDAEMRELAEAELPSLREALPGAERAMQLALLPKDAADARPAILEIRPGTGGDEAALFADDLLRMYQRYAETTGLSFEIIEEARTELGGVKEVVASIKGQNVFARLKFESGVHRVQRVPSTESGGRIHTSAATVAVLPEAEDVDIEIRQEDIRVDTMRAS
ncbi:MAG: PCRF domain-containing protein, partial [Pseudomonadota bacterium]